MSRILKIETLPSVKEASWLDRDGVMLHACFQILTDFVEKEVVPNEFLMSFDTPEGKICKELYDWWIVRRDRPEQLDDESEIDDEQLIKLMKIRTTLWT